MTVCYIALGSNLGNPRLQVNSALQAIKNIPETRLLATSPGYQSKAVGPGEQADYINAVARLETDLAADAMLQALQGIEQEHGRQRTQRWGARTLDLDILLYGDSVINSEQLQVPHPRLTERNFVLYPLYDLSPALVLPCGTPIESLLASCPREGLQAFGELSDPGL